MVSARLDSMLARKLNVFHPLSPDEINSLAGLLLPSFKVKRGGQFIQEGQTGHQAFVLQTGWACSYKVLLTGSRQIISLPIAGDCVGLRSILLRTADCSFEALTDAVVNPVDSSRMLKVFSKFPQLGAAILWAASRDEAMVVEHLVSLGRRSAIERMAHLFLELAERLTSIGLAKGNEFKCPLTQYVLADVLGLSAIHVNRVLHQLRRQELLTVRHGSVQIHDVNGLRRLAGFHGTYLPAAFTEQNLESLNGTAGFVTV